MFFFLFHSSSQFIGYLSPADTYRLLYTEISFPYLKDKKLRVTILLFLLQYYSATILLLILFAWIGNTVNNLLLLYVTGKEFIHRRNAQSSLPGCISYMYIYIYMSRLSLSDRGSPHARIQTQRTSTLGREIHIRSLDSSSLIIIVASYVSRVHRISSFHIPLIHVLAIRISS